jgi:hypothetical protein
MAAYYENHVGISYKSFAVFVVFRFWTAVFWVYSGYNTLQTDSWLSNSTLKLNIECYPGTLVTTWLKVICVCMYVLLIEEIFCSSVEYFLNYHLPSRLCMGTALLIKRLKIKAVNRNRFWTVYRILSPSNQIRSGQTKGFYGSFFSFFFSIRKIKCSTSVSHYQYRCVF